MKCLLGRANKKAEVKLKEIYLPRRLVPSIPDGKPSTQYNLQVHRFKAQRLG